MRDFGFHHGTLGHRHGDRTPAGYCPLPPARYLLGNPTAAVYPSASTILAAVLGASMLGPAILGGCASGDGTVLFGSGERAVAIGDWDDLDDAVSVGARKCEMALLSAREEGDDVRIYELLTAGDEPARAVLRRVAALDRSALGTDAEGIQIEAFVGRFGDADRERGLVSAIRARLGDLAGVDFAPVR